MQKVFISIVSLFLICQASAQTKNDSVNITLSSTIIKEGNVEVLYVGVLIKSQLDKPIVIDDSQGWITCPNAVGVKLLRQYLTDSCFSESSSSDCHGLPGDKRTPVKKVLQPFQTYSYLIRFLQISRLLEENGTSRIQRSVGVFRFKLELPYWIDGKLYTASNRKWHYHSL